MIPNTHNLNVRIATFWQGSYASHGLVEKYCLRFSSPCHSFYMDFDIPFKPAITLDEDRLAALLPKYVTPEQIVKMSQIVLKTYNPVEQNFYRSILNLIETKEDR